MVTYSLIFREKKTVADGTDSFIFDKPEGFVFEAGQYMVLKLEHLVAPDTQAGTRSFSFSSAPFEERLVFTMRQGISGFKQTMYALKPGDTVQATGPVGRFTLSHAADNLPIVFLVGGVGVTPMRSILKQAEHDTNERSFTAFYSNRFEKDAAFHQELKSLQLSHYRYVSTLTQETMVCAGGDEERGYICEAMVQKYVPDPKQAWFFMVGSPVFIEAMEKMLADLGVSKEKQICDPFTGLTKGPKQ